MANDFQQALSETPLSVSIDSIDSTSKGGGTHITFIGQKGTGFRFVFLIPNYDYWPTHYTLERTSPPDAGQPPPRCQHLHHNIIGYEDYREKEQA